MSSKVWDGIAYPFPNFNGAIFIAGEWFGSSWWRHQMETFSALLAPCAGNSPVPVNSQHKGQWRGALIFSLICARINDWVNNREAGDLRRYRGHYDVIVMDKLTDKSVNWITTGSFTLSTLIHNPHLKSIKFTFTWWRHQMEKFSA